MINFAVHFIRISYTKNRDVGGLNSVAKIGNNKKQKKHVECEKQGRVMFRFRRTDANTYIIMEGSKISHKV